MLLVTQQKLRMASSVQPRVRVFNSSLSSLTHLPTLADNVVQIHILLDVLCRLLHVVLSFQRLYVHKKAVVLLAKGESHVPPEVPVVVGEERKLDVGTLSK